MHVFNPLVATNSRLFVLNYCTALIVPATKYKIMKRYILLSALLLTLLNSFAQKNWLQGAGGNANDEALAITHDLNGNVYSTGYFSQASRFDNIIVPSSGMSDVFISKQDSLGVYQWVVNAGGLQDDKGFGIAVNAAGEIFITGVFRGTSQFGSTTLTSVGGSQDIFVSKLDNSGNFIWAQSYGGPDTDLANDIVVDGAGNITTVGEFKGTASFGAFTFTSVNYPLSMPSSGGLPSYDAFIFKANSLGNVIWAKQGAAHYDDRILKVELDINANIYVCGQFSDTLTFTSTYNNNAFNAGLLMKLDSAGNELWFRRMISSQFMIYDMKVKKQNVWLTGDFQGTLVYCGTPNNYVTNTSPYKSFALKVRSTDGDFLAGTSVGSDNSISSRAITVDEQESAFTTGFFKCELTSFSAIYGNGIFNSVGYRDVYLVKYDSLLNRVWEKQFGGIGDDYPTSASIYFDNNPVIAGSYDKNFNTPDGANFYTHVNNLNTHTNNYGATICGNSNGGAFMTQKGYGNKDILVTRPANSVAPLYDYFSRLSGTCLLDTLAPTRWPGTDTISGCDKVSVYIFTPTTKDSVQAPDWVYSWSNGSARDTAVFTTSGWNYVNYGYADDCRTFVDSFYVQIYATPPVPVITAYQALFMAAIPYAPCLYKSFIQAGDTAIFVASNIPAGYSFHWNLPAGGTSTNDTIYATTPGVYTITSSSPGGLCSNSQCVSLFVWTSGSGGGGPLVSVVPQLIFTDSTFNYTDTVEVCKDDHFEMQLIDSALYASGAFPGIFAFANWTITGGYVFDPYLSYPTTFIDHRQKFKAVSSGNCVATADILDPITGAVWGTISRNFYLNVHAAPANSPVISGANYFCPGDSVQLEINGGDNYVWYGPGIVQTNMPANDSALVNIQGMYQVFSTTIDPVLGCIDQAWSFFSLGSMPTPLVDMLPTNGLICPFDSVKLTAQPGSSYAWYGPTGMVLGTTQSIYTSTPGFYYYTYVSTTGCALVSEMVEVKEYSTPYLDAAPGTSICASGTVIISLETNESSLINWSSPFSGSSLFQTVTSPGTYTVSVNSCGITTVANITITSGMGTPVDILYWGNDTICSQDTVVLLGSNGYTDYTWFPSMDLGQSFTTIGPGTYFLQATNMEGCISSDSIVIYEFAPTTPPTSSDTVVCPGTSLILTAAGSGTLSWFDDFYSGTQIGSGTTLPVTIGQNDSTFYVGNFNGTCMSALEAVNVSLFSGSQRPDILGDNTLCLGDTLFLEVNDPAAGITYTWNGPGLTPVISTSLSINSISPAQSGIYWVTTSGGVCVSQSDSVTVIVNNPTLQNFASSTYTICQYDSIVLEADTLIGIYLWNDGTIGAANYVSVAGPYYYSYTDAIGCIAFSDTTTLVVLSAPTITPIPDTSVCLSSPLSFTATTDSTLMVNWYDVSHTLLTTGTTYSIPSVTGPTILIVEVTDANGCTSLSDTIIISINPPLSSPLTSVNDSLCAGNTLSLTAGTIAGYTYNWSGPAGFTSNATNPVITPVDLMNSGTYSLYIVNGYCMSDTATVEISVAEQPIVIACADVVICFGDTANLTATSSTGNQIWSIGSGSNSIFVNPTSTTTYSVEATNMCGTVFDYVTVTVNPLPSCDAGSDITLLLGESGVLNGSGSGTYLWTPSTDLSCNTCSDPAFTIPESQYFYLTVTDANGCSNTDSVFVFISDESSIFIPNAFTPNGDGNNDIFLVEGDDIATVDMSIFNRWGDEIFRSNDKTVGWNGKYKGVAVEPVVYVYKINVTMTNGDLHKLRGTVTVVK